MNNYFCNGYLGTGTVWPQQPFPGNLFPGWDNRRRQQAKLAWNFFEEVEAADAATRVRLSNQGGWKPPAPGAFASDDSIWYPIATEGNHLLYKQGLLLHQQACAGIDWQAQRSMEIPSTPLTNVYPAPLA